MKLYVDFSILGIGSVKYLNKISSYFSLIISLASKKLLQTIASIELVPRVDKIDFISFDLTIGAFTFLIIIPILFYTNLILDFLQFIF